MRTTRCNRLGWVRGMVTALGFVAVLLSQALSARASCPQQYVSVTVVDPELGFPWDSVQVDTDGCAPDTGPACGGYLQRPNQPAPTSVIPIGFPAMGTGNGDYYLSAHAAVYGQSGPSTPVLCRKPEGAGCYTCSPSEVTVYMYPCSGALDGTVSVEQGLAETPPSLKNIPVCLYDTAGGKLSEAYTDENGYYRFGTFAKIEPYRSHNWGIAVPTIDCPTYGRCGCQTRDVEVGLCGQGPEIGRTIVSSQLRTVDLTKRNPDNEETDDRTCGEDGRGPCSSAGHPVNVVTGNMFFDQVDAEAASPGGGLRFLRAYNSAKVGAGQYGAFGPGWFHSYERRLTFPWPTVVMLREADGIPLYFDDTNGDGTYTASRPITDRSRIVRQADGTFRRLFRDGASETYAASGRLERSADASGNETTLNYDAGGHLVAIAAANGRTLTLDYVGTRIASLTGPMGLIATYSYDAENRLASVTYPESDGYTFTYDDSDRILVVRDMAGLIVESHEYDTSGRATVSEIANGRELYTFAYDSTNRRTTITDALGAATTYDWRLIHGSHRITRITGPCPSCGGGAGETQQWTYDTLGRVLTHTDAAGVVTRLTYNAQADVETETQALGLPLERTTTYAYTYDGERIATLTVTTPVGGVTTTTYGTAGPTRVDQKVSATETRTTTMTYTPQGQLDTIKDPRGQTTGKVTDLGYNMAGDLTSSTDPLLHTTTFGYDDLGRRTSVTDALSHTTATTHDAQGRVARITAHDGTYTEFGYDGSGRRVSVTDPMGKVTRYVYDDYGWLKEVVDPAGGLTAYGYDLMGRMTSLTDANGHTTSFEYDDYGRVEKVTYPGTASETFVYNSAGRLETKTDRKGVITTYSHDDLGRLKGKTYSDGVTPVASYNYDEDGQIGRLTSASNGTDTLRWTYSLTGDLMSEQSAKNSSTVAYTYEADGNRLTVKLNGELHVTYGYDDGARLTTITRGTAVFGLGYDNADRRTAMTYPNGVNTVYAYDTLNRLLNLSAVHTPSSTTITNFTYTYDAASNRTSKQTLDFTETYGYDKLYQLTGVDRTGIPAKRWGFTYDPVGNRLSNQLDDSVITATYNEKNQLVSQGAGGPVRWRGQLDEVGTVTFTSATVNGKPARMLPGNIFEADLDMQPGTNLVTLQATDASRNTRTQQYSVDVSGAGATYTYDANGNLETKVEGADTWHYYWNAENQLTKVENNSVEVARFSYDPVGRRAGKVASGVASAWAYDAEDVLNEVVASTPLRYVHGPGIDEPLAREDGDARAYYHVDGLGSVVKLTDRAAAVVETSEYDVWGNRQAGASDRGFAFTGREWDPETRTYYYRARYYDPVAGRFVSRDPLGYVRGSDEYLYAANNPVELVDPSGLMSRRAQCVLSHTLAFGTAGALAGATAGAVAGAAVGGAAGATAGGAATIPVGGAGAIPGGAGGATAGGVAGALDGAVQGGTIGGAVGLITGLLTCPPDDSCPKDDDKKTCKRLLGFCLEDPWQNPFRKKQWGPRKDCGACYRECVANGGAWPFEKCPIF